MIYKIYDLDKIKNQINNNVETVSIGMEEDWFWTATTIYEKNKFVKEVEEQLKDKTLMIAGICGSYWATPIMKIKYKNGNSTQLECYKEIEKNKESDITREWERKRNKVMNKGNMIS